MNQKVIDKSKFPIEVLRQSILDYLKVDLPELNEIFKEEVEFENLSKYIVYQYTSEPIQIVAQIKTNSGNNQIIFYDNYLQFLWSLCYSFLTVYDQISKKKHKNIFNNNIFITALKVFGAGMSLFKVYNTQQFYDLPNPSNIFTDDSDEYISKATNIYRYAFYFIFAHELSHNYLGHLSKANNPKSNEELKNEEYKADDFAIGTLLDTINSKSNFDLRIGIVTALCSLIFLDDTMKGGSIHPDPDDRLKNALEKLTYNETDPLWRWASIFFKIWSVYNKKEIFLDKQFDNDFLTFKYFYEECKKIKYY